MPQTFDRVTTLRFHISFLAALLPAVFAAIWLQGWGVLVTVVLAVGTAWGCDQVLRRLRGVQEPQDGAAFVWGLLLALMLPVEAPAYLPVVGSAVAIFVVKGLFGRGGAPWINPILIAWAFLQANWGSVFPALGPLNTELRTPFDVQATEWVNTNLFSWLSIQLPGGYLDLFVGLGHPQNSIIAESGVLFLLLGTIYLLARGFLPWEIPAFFFLSFSLATAMAGGNVLFEMFSGTLLLNLFFLAPDPSSRPLGRWGLIVFASGAGLLTFLVRTWGLESDGVGYAVLCMNLLVPWLDQRLRRKTLNDFRLA